MNKFPKAVILLSIIASAAFAQYLPVTGDKQVTLGMLGVSGNNGFIMLRKFKTETMSNRYNLEFGYNVSSTTNPSNPGYTRTQKNSAINAGFSFGKQRNFNIGERFSPYLALDAGIYLNYIPSNNSDNMLVDSAAANSNSANNYRYVSSLNSTTNTSLSPGVFIRPIIGFNYYIAKNFALGAECRFNVLSLNYTTSKNTVDTEYSHIVRNPVYDQNGNITSYSNSLINTTPTHTKSDGNAFNISGSITPTFYITASYYFK